MEPFDFAGWKTAYEPLVWSAAWAGMVIGVAVMLVRDYLGRVGR